jgi:glucokinase
MDRSGGGSVSRHLGLDLGGTNIKWAVTERHGDAWSTVAYDQVPTRIDPDPFAVPAGVVAQLGDIASSAASAHGPFASIGVGVPGLYYPATGQTKFLVNVPGPWDGQPVAVPVAATTGLPVALINDARAFGLAELRLGAGRGHRSMIGITMGTGLGGVICLDGAVVQGRDGTAGEIGHQTLDASDDAPWCNCGKRGCLEAFARADRIAEACGTATVGEAFARARAGDAQAMDGLARVARWIGIGLANAITLVTPEIVVIGGGVSAGAYLLLDGIRTTLRERVTTTAVDDIALVTAQLGTWAGAIGAAVHGAERAATVVAVDAADADARIGDVVRARSREG